MDSSSEGSFAWTDASNDTFDSGAMAKDHFVKTYSEDESISGKSYKKKLQQELFAECNGDVNREEQLKPKERKRKLTGSSEHASPKKKKIKREPESDIDVSEKLTNGHDHSVSHDAYHETYLDIKVKAEQEFATPSLGKTKKNRSKSLLDSEILHSKMFETEKISLRKNENNSCEETDIDNNKSNQFAQDENESHKKKRKKKKKVSKTRKDSMSDETKHQDSHMKVCETIEDSCSDSPTPHSEADVTSHLHSAEPDTKANNNTFSLDDSENCSNEEMPKVKLQPDLPFNKSVTFNVHDAAVPRVPRISERIQFEEDESSEMETSQPQSTKTTISSSKIKTYLKNNLNLKPSSSKLKQESLLTVDDEIWIVRCPRDVDIDAFQNKDITLEGKCKLKLNGQTYEGTIDSESDNMSILSSDGSDFIIKSLPVKGLLNLHKRIPKCHMRDEVTVSKPPNFILLPETKCRHPLFGVNYRKAIKLAGGVRSRLCAAAALPAPPLSVPHREPAGEPAEEHHQSLACNKTKKKRKHLESEKVATKKKRRSKHDLESAEAWESEKAIEENLFNF